MKGRNIRAKVTFDVPDDVLGVLDCSPEKISQEVRLAAAVFWYHREELSIELAAKLAGMDRITFMEALANRKIDSIVLDIEDLKEELARPLASEVPIGKIKQELARASPPSD